MPKVDITARKKELKKLKKQVIYCRKCPLYKERKKAVFGIGNISSKILLIGQSPGKEEDKVGIPFVGRAGKLLFELLNSAKIKNKEVFITNLVKCHPLNNRDPKAIEINTCQNYLDKQINLIKPKVIIALGRLSSKYLFKKFNIPFTCITKLHGKIFNVFYDKKKIKIIPMYHPAFALYKKKNKKTLEKDFLKINQLI